MIKLKTVNYYKAIELKKFLKAHCINYDWRFSPDSAGDIERLYDFTIPVAELVFAMDHCGLLIWEHGVEADNVYIPINSFEEVSMI